MLRLSREPVDKTNEMGWFRCALSAVVIALFCAGNAHAQTTQPVDSWSTVLTQLSDVLRGTNLDALNVMLAGGPVIRTFSSHTVQPPDQLLGATSGCKLIGVHAYLKAPTSLATDLADDFKSADVPDDLRHDMLIADRAAERSANEIAARWVSQILQPSGGQAIGVIVLWCQERSSSFSTSSNRPVFLMVKADLADGKYVFRQVIFGDPLEKKR